MITRSLFLGFLLGTCSDLSCRTNLLSVIQQKHYQKEWNSLHDLILITCRKAYEEHLILLLMLFITTIRHFGFQCTNDIAYLEFITQPSLCIILYNAFS